MAAKEKTTTKASGSKRSSGTAARAGSGTKTKTGRNSAAYKKENYDPDTADQDKGFIGSEALIILFFLFAVLLFLSNFGLIGAVGKVLKSVQMGLFGVLGYVFPVLLFLAAAFCVSNRGNSKAALKVAAVFVATISLAGIIHVLFGKELLMEDFSEIGKLYTMGRYGGFLGGVIASLLYKLVKTVGTVLILLAILIISLVFITERSFVSAVRHGSRKAYDRAREDAERIKEERIYRYEEKRRARDKALVENIDFAATDLQTHEGAYDEERELAATIAAIKMKDNDEFSTPEDTLQKNGAGVRVNPDVFTGRIISPASCDEDDTVPFDDDTDDELIPDTASQQSEYDISDSDEVLLDSELLAQLNGDVYSVPDQQYSYETDAGITPDKLRASSKSTAAGYDEAAPAVSESAPLRMTDRQRAGETANVRKEIEKKKKANRPYRIPPMNLLQRSGRSSGASDKDYKDTAVKLQQTLSIFGVAVTVTDISVGPTVTRYELHPEQGVKVSDIMSLQNDIKLALAAPSIRIEAPIPGKAAVGIEVPNTENSVVCLRDILETPDYKGSDAKIAFAIGKDISGKTVVSDIAKMPHLLIAGATGSGKSVSINTLILSILYKYSPDDVKLILVDPKVVELSVYNGIPHLLIPVVNDPKKAAGALNWAVNEMMDRYKKFETYGARDIKAYNAKVEQVIASGVTEDVPEKLPLICIIIDELADLMMVAKGEVEEAICRIAQLARAAGIHLVIATQRPSVNVITGLIKANIPSRIAFAVSSGVDSRTILDGVGAEKLLGKGDMLFAPQGAPKPIRVQGAFVSDQEIQKVIDYVKKQDLGTSYDENTFEQMTLKSAGLDIGGPSNERDELFVQAARLIIDKQKASIGVLQRAFRIGFNRAARIMEQLCDAGVVGPEQGTKPRDVLMTEEEFNASMK